MCLAAAALVVWWQYSSPLESSGETPSRSREPMVGGKGGIGLDTTSYRKSVDVQNYHV